MIVFLGALGYQKIEKMSLIDSLYMAIITLSTVGYREVHPLSDKGKVFTIIFIITGIALMSYTVFTALNFCLKPLLKTYFPEEGKE